ncbi:MAG: peptidase M15 [Bacteroidales bacterium]|nr:peptidase M15 [Bacteroidales bacterium]MBP5689308.1 peptidase M15 [Bacteroidales bacterium]
MPKYFTLKELCDSETAKRKGIDNFPTFEIAEHLLELTEKILDPLRVAWGGPIHVNSGYRSPMLNKAVGGVARSVHQIGYAADLCPSNGKTEQFIDFARAWIIASKIKFDQFIHETSADGKTVWLHIGLYNNAGAQRGQFLNLVKR